MPLPTDLVTKSMASLLLYDLYLVYIILYIVHVIRHTTAIYSVIICIPTARNRQRERKREQVIKRHISRAHTNVIYII